MPEPFLEPLSERLKDMREIVTDMREQRTATDPEFMFAYSPLDRDMLRFEATRMVEARLTHAWHELTWRCCMEGRGLVIDVGGNYGWYTLFSAALGCNVIVFEPVEQFRSVIFTGLARNPGFATRVNVRPNIVYDRPGSYTLRVPVPVPGSRFKRMLGMAGLVDGSFGMVKGVIDNYINVTASAVRIDDLEELGLRVQQHPYPHESSQPLPSGGGAPLPPVCMLKADVEGYEPQVLQTADRLLRSGRVRNIQLELSKPSDMRSRAGQRQREETIRMLRDLSSFGFELMQVPNDVVDSNFSVPPRGQGWRESAGPWGRGLLLPFPSSSVLARTRERMARNKRAVRRKASRDARAVLEAAWPMAYTRDVNTQSTNVIGRRRTT